MRYADGATPGRGIANAVAARDQMPAFSGVRLTAAIARNYHLSAGEQGDGDLGGRNHFDFAGHRRGTGSRERMRRLFAQEAGNMLRQRLTGLDSAALDALCDAAARGEIGHEDAVAKAIRLVMKDVS